MNDAITVVGRLGGDPILKSVNGDQVAEFRLASTARRKEGEAWVDGHTNWYSVEAWGKQAAHVTESLRRGDVVLLLGSLKIDQWESGEKRGTSVKIRADHIGHSLRVGPVTRERASALPADGIDDASFPAEPEHEPALVAAGGGGDWGATASPAFAA